VRGRKPTPVEQKVRDGNPGHRPLPDVVTVAGRPAPVEVADPPGILGADGQAWWVETIPLAAESGMLDRIDRTQLVFMATQWDHWIKAQRVIAQDGFFTRGSVGQLREHPALKIAREAEAAFNKVAEMFGFNPMGRTRLGLQVLSGAAKAAELERMLDGDDGVTVEGQATDVGLPGL
jgi:P27 family predicted phage terminase small subunit